MVCTLIIVCRQDWKSCRGHSYWGDHQGCLQVWKVNNQKLKNASEWTLPLLSKQPQTMPEFQIQKWNGRKLIFFFLRLAHLFSSCYWYFSAITFVVFFLLLYFLKHQERSPERKRRCGRKSAVKNSYKWFPHLEPEVSRIF